MPILVVQMGHAGRTTGATGAPGEMAFTQAVGAACVRLLNRDGWSVRPIVADPSSARYRGDAFIAVHADGSTNPAVRGASVGYQNASGAGLAHAWGEAYAVRGFTGPWKPDNYTTNLAQYYGVTEALRQGNTRACVIECGTITSTEDRALMLPDRVALAIGDALGIHTEEAGMTWGSEVTQKQIDDMQSRVASMHAGQYLPWADGHPGGDLSWFQEQSTTALEPVKAELAEVREVLTEMRSMLAALTGAGLVLRPAGEITVTAVRS